MPDPPFVPAEFAVPAGLVTDEFVLEPLGPEHNEPDYAAWTSSIEHIRATPGFAGQSWPDPGLSLDGNAADLRRHRDDFRARRGFTYTVLDPGDRRVVGCVYLYPSRRPGHDVEARSWVRHDRADLDGPLYRTVTGWLRDHWPWVAPEYAPR